MGRKGKSRDWGEIFSISRTVVADLYRFFASLVYSINLIPPERAKAQDVLSYGDACLAVITPSWKLYINPELLDGVVEKHNLDPYALALSVWLHEIYHLLRKHHLRAEGKIHLLWNIATDLEENDDLVETLRSRVNPAFVSSLVDSKVLITPQHLGLPDGLSAEEYYALLLTRGNEIAQVLKQIYLQGEDDVERVCFDSLVQGDEDIQTGKGVSELAQESILRDTARKIVEHQKRIGSVPANLLRWAEGYIESKVDWVSILRRLVRRKAEVYPAKSGDYTYLKPHKLSRWTSNPPVIYPSVVAPKFQVAVLVDTSASMGSDELEKAIAEVRGIVRSGGYLTYIVSCDTEVHKVEKVWGERLHHEKIALVGGGGTNLVNGLLWIQDNIKPPPLTIVLTDGHTVWKDIERVKLPVICCLVGKGRASPESVPPQIEVILEVD